MNKHRQTLSDEELEIERLEFHKWANFYCHSIDRDFDGDYKFDTTHDLWESWQSAVASYKWRLTEQEPVFYINSKVLNNRTGKIDSTVKNALTWSRNKCQSWSMPLYTHPTPAKPYSIDKDEGGIRELVASAIVGTITAGAEGSEAPPKDHWLSEFYKIGFLAAGLQRLSQKGK